MVLYLGGLGTERVKLVCGAQADAFYLGNCTPGKKNLKEKNIYISNFIGITIIFIFIFSGWAFYSAVIGIVLTIVCALLSAQAEKSTASDKVQDKMNEGQTLICLA